MKPAWVGEGAASGPDPRTGRCAAHGLWPGGTEPLLGHRFLRHVPVVYVDYPGPASLTQIYGTFNRAMLRLIPSLRTYAEPLTAAMVEFYTMSQVRSSASGRRAPRGDWAFSEPLCRCRPGLPLPVLHPQSGSCPFGPRLYVCADECPLRSRACTVPSLKGHAPRSQRTGPSSTSVRAWFSCSWPRLRCPSALRGRAGDTPARRAASPCPRHVSIWEVFVSKVSAPGCTEAVASCVSL